MMINIEAYLRIRPLEGKAKPKHNYYTIKEGGGVQVLGHPMAWAQPLATQQKL